MLKKFSITLCLVFALHAALCGAQKQGATSPYPAMAPMERYLMAKDAEIALARSAAPPSIGNAAEVLVLGRDGYSTAAKGSNGFLCIVERSWGSPTDAPEFWNPSIRGPICFNAAAARTVVPAYLRKTKLALAGKSKGEIAEALKSAFERKELPGLETGAMCYMLAKGQYLTDSGKNWHPHLMFFEPGDAAKSWGANLDDSPVIAANVPEEHLTIFMVWVDNWSDGTPGPNSH